MSVMDMNLTEVILDRAHNAAVSMDDRGLVTYWNPSAEHMFGLTRRQAVGRPVADLIVPERFRAAHCRGLERFLDSGTGPVLDRRIELAALRADGSEFPIEMTISALQDGEWWMFHAFIQDITERKEAELERERLLEELRLALQGSERRFDAIVGSLSDAVTIRDREHRFLYANSAALSHLGFESWEQLRDTPPEAIMSDYLVQDEHGGEIAMEDIPSVRILRGEKTAEPLLIRTVHRETGAQRWNLLKAAPLRDEHGEVEATIMIIEEVTEQKRAELRSAFLAQASTVLASSLDYEQTLRNVAELAVPEAIPDWCAVDLVDADGDRRTVAVAHVDPERLALAEEIRKYVPDRVDPEQGMGRVLVRGRRCLLGTPMRCSRGQLSTIVIWSCCARVGFRSALIVPMRLGERTLGAMTLVGAESARTLDEYDLELAEQVGARAAVAVENSRLYSERSSIAQTLQQSLLPEELPEIPGYELSSFSTFPRSRRAWSAAISTTSGDRRQLDDDHRRRHRKGHPGRRADRPRSPHDANSLTVPVKPSRAARDRRCHPEGRPSGAVGLHRPLPAPEGRSADPRHRRAPPGRCRSLRRAFARSVGPARCWAASRTPPGGITRWSSSRAAHCCSTPTGSPTHATRRVSASGRSAYAESSRIFAIGRPRRSSQG